MKRFYICLSLLFLLISCSNPEVSNIKTALNNYSNAIKEKDYSKMVAFLLPELVSQAGGVAAITEEIKTSSSQFTINDIKFDNVQIQSGDGDKMVAVIDAETYGILHDKKNTQVKTISNIYGVSYDKGNNWYLFEGNEQSKQIIIRLVPSAVQKLKFRNAEFFINNNGIWEKFN